MKKVLCAAMGCLMLLALTACGGSREPISMERIDIGGKSAIIWDDRTYYPFCVISKNDRGEEIGSISGDQNDRISEYKDYPSEKWIVNWLPMDGGAILYKEENTVDIPDGLVSEYD